MSTPRVHPVLDPLAHKAAIDALEAQRAAYRRYARAVDAQRGTLGDGDADRAVSAVDRAASDYVDLTDGARRLEPLVRRVREVGSADQLHEMQRQMEQLVHEARQAETAIQNMSTQLEAWRDAYGRQLAEVGLTPGPRAGDDARQGPYGAAPPGRHPEAGRVTVLDRRG